MNTVFLQKLGINDEDPNVVHKKLGKKEIELLDQRDLAETNGADDKVKEIDALLEQLKKEREIVKEEAKTYVSKKEKAPSEKENSKAQSAKRNAAYEKLMQKKKEEAKADGEKVPAGVAKSNGQQDRTAKAQSTAQKSVQNTAQKSAPPPTSAQNSQNTTQQNAQPKAASAATPSQTQQNAQTQKTAATASASGNGEYSNGLRYYQKQDYANAYKCFLNVAEAKSVADQAATQERIQASYLLAIMYRDGVGTSRDTDRSNHYLKRAADFGYDQAQFEYGTLVLSQHRTTTDSDLKARKEGWKYIEMAADAGLTNAIKKYIDLAKNSADTDKHIIAKAKKYVSLIKGQLDSYEAQKCDDWVKELNESEKTARKKTSYPKKFIIGEILFLIGTLYLFKGLNPFFFEESIPQVGKFIPDIPDILIIKWSRLVKMTEPFMTHQGIFGGWIIILGNLIRGLGVEHVVPKRGTSKYKSKYKYKKFDMVIMVSIILLCVLHFVANIIETSHFFGNGGTMQFFAMIGCILIGRALGWIAYKIIK